MQMIAELAESHEKTEPMLGENRPPKQTGNCRSNQKKLYGALAALSFVSNANLYAERKGFFVLRCGDRITTIQNKPDFQPKPY